MTPARIVFALLVALGGALAALAQVDGLEPRVAMWVIFGSSLINGFLRVLETPVERVTRRSDRPPPVPPILSLFCVVLVACTDATTIRTKLAAEQAAYAAALDSCYESNVTYLDYENCADDVDRRFGVKK